MRRNIELETLRSQYRDQILTSAAAHKAGNIRVFGSVVRGEATETSDVDFLAHFKKGASLFDVAGLTNDLSNLLGVKVDVIPDDSIHWFIRDKILKESVPL